MPKYSKWHPPEIKPVHVGWYDVANRKREPYFTPPWFMHWNGHLWNDYDSVPVERHHDFMSIQEVPWRGLARKP